MKLPWRKEPVTHAFALWIVVGFATVLLVVFVGYSRLLTGLEKGLVQVNPPKTEVQRQLPSVFGNVTSVEDGLVRVDSKQSFSVILVDDVTRITRVGGGSYNLEMLGAGAKVMATGYDSGDGQLLADALVVLEE